MVPSMNITKRICLIITHLPGHALDLLHHLFRLPHLSLSARRELLLGVNLRKEANTKRGFVFREPKQRTNFKLFLNLNILQTGNHVRDVVSHCSSQLLELSAKY